MGKKQNEASMNIDAIITSLLKNDTVLQGMVGSKVYPLYVYQGNDFPMLAYKVLERTPERGAGKICMRNFDLLITITSKKHLEAIEIGEEVVRTLDNYKGNVGGADINKCHYEGMVANESNTDEELYLRALEFSIKVNNN